MRILLPIRTGSIGTGRFSLRQTGKSQKASPSCPYGFFSMTLIVLEKRERLIPKGGIETKHSAATTLQLPLMFDALEWRSKVEFRPGHALEEGMSPQIVMTFTGHEDYDSLKPYIAITDKTRKNLMTTMFSK